MPTDLPTHTLTVLNHRETPSVDLTRKVPRSGYESLGGIVFVPRAIDKARADVSGSIGSYFSRTGFSADLFEFLGISVDAFHNAVKTCDTDAEVLAWLKTNMANRSSEEVTTWNTSIMTRVPTTPEGKARYRQFMEDMDQAHRTDVTRQLDRLDLDEGRDVPLGGRC
jgi:hypothetical protein